MDGAHLRRGREQLPRPGDRTVDGGRQPGPRELGRLQPRGDRHAPRSSRAGAPPPGGDHRARPRRRERARVPHRGIQLRPRRHVLHRGHREQPALRARGKHGVRSHRRTLRTSSSASTSRTITSTRNSSTRWCRDSSCCSLSRSSSNLLARELVGERDRQLRRSIELEHAAFAELREVDRIKSEFMMLASHELRTPLTKIKAWLTLMHDAGDRLPQDARDEGLHELRLEAEHLARLTDNLLCIAQLEFGRDPSQDCRRRPRERVPRSHRALRRVRLTTIDSRSPLRPTRNACLRTTSASHWSWRASSTTR